MPRRRRAASAALALCVAAPLAAGLAAPAGAGKPRTGLTEFPARLQLAAVGEGCGLDDSRRWAGAIKHNGSEQIGWSGAVETGEAVLDLDVEQRLTTRRQGRWSGRATVETWQRATPDGDGYRITGAKAWITHGGIADFYNLFARTADGSQGISCFLVPRDTAGLTFGRPEEKMGLHAVPTTAAHYDDAFVAADRRIGAEGQGLQIAFSALDSGRLGIAAVAVGLAQAALDEAVSYSQQRTTFGRRIIDHQGLGFLLADMAAAVDAARATYLDAARRRDAGMSYSRQASVAKLIATDAAMKVTTDAVQVFGGAGYTRDYPVERYMREAKIMQIFEGTNQIQRLVISRHLAR